MYTAIDSQDSCALAWLAAMKKVSGEPGHKARNVIVNVRTPLASSATDRAITAKVDTVLRAGEALPVQSVANTIFPQAIYDRYGYPGLYEAYIENIWNRIKTSNDWGRYFERMISFPITKGGKPINPLDDIVKKMRSKVGGDRCFKNVYELTIYDPTRDAGKDMNRQCMSFLSFHLTDDSPRRLMLTAIYRNHYYTARLLGNLIGLGRLMGFVAKEAGIEVGELTVVSTHAEVDSPANTRSKVDDLIAQCTDLAASNTAKAA